MILYDVSEGVCTVTLNRPEKLNAVTSAMLGELRAAFDRADADDAVRAVIVTGAGRAFCAGADLSAGGKTFDRVTRGGSSARGLTSPTVGGEGAPTANGDAQRDGGGLVSLRIYEMKKPVIAAINGPAVGFGITSN